MPVSETKPKVPTVPTVPTVGPKRPYVLHVINAETWVNPEPRDPQEQRILKQYPEDGPGRAPFFHCIIAGYCFQDRSSNPTNGYSREGMVAFLDDAEVARIKAEMEVTYVRLAGKGAHRKMVGTPFKPHAKEGSDDKRDEYRMDPSTDEPVSNWLRIEPIA